AKKASLQKRVAQLTQVELLVLGEGVDDVFDFIKEAVPGWQQLPLYRLEETGKIVAFFETRLAQSRPVLNGLVLAGGKSLRMGGNDKGAMAWHGKEQRYYVADMLKTYCDEVYISCRPEQLAEIAPTHAVLPDTFSGLGPYGAILSAFRAQPDRAWLVVACDLPLLNDAALGYLIQHRDTQTMATTFISPYDGLPEPLITIWEPKSYPELLSFLSQGYSCPRKALINSATTLLTAPDPDALMNVNTPGDVELAKEKLRAI
ncbi:MAG TPA: NTP transferase domain-containing protein, partial [Chitinophagaceae bacterium]|nr:NTP transferase domain-containing protein [Chitinophagaceae bacterium]